MIRTKQPMRCRSGHPRACTVAVTVAIVVACGLIVGGCGGRRADSGRLPETGVASGAARTAVGPPSAAPSGALSSPELTPSPLSSAALLPSSNRSLAPTPPMPSPWPLPSRTRLAPTGFTLHIPILTYHLIATPAEAVGALPGLVVPPSLFDAQLTTLADAGWRTITLGTLATDVASHVRPPAQTFVITIDDGHRDGYTEALPILRKHGMVATFFVVAGRLGRGTSLSADQLRGLVAAGMEIGDHTMFHVNLNGVSPAALQAEIRRPLALIAGITGVTPTVFAYPFGDEDSTVLQAVADAGLAMAVTTHFGAVEAMNLRLWVPRLHVGPGEMPDFLLALVTWLARS